MSGFSGSNLPPRSSQSRLAAWRSTSRSGTVRDRRLLGSRFLLSPFLTLSYGEALALLPLVSPDLPSLAEELASVADPAAEPVRAVFHPTTGQLAMAANVGGLLLCE